MEEKLDQDLSVMACSLCKTPMESLDVYCPECGYPENGTDAQRAQFHAKTAINKNKNMDADRKIKSARNMLYVMAGIILAFGFINFFDDNDIGILMTNVILGIIYLVLGSYTSKNALVALLLGLLLYLTNVIISAIVDPETILRGIIFKIIVIAYLGMGVYSASSIKK